MAGHHAVDLHVGKFEAPQKLKTLSYAFILIGVITFAVGLMQNQERLWTSYLTSFFFFSCLGIGGLFFVAINYAAHAGWSVSIRRYAEALTSFLPVILIGGILLFFGFKHLYPWAAAQPEAIHVAGGKALYLKPGFVLFRIVLFAVGLLIFRKILVGNSIKQDQSGDEKLTLKNQAWSVGFIAFFALLFSLFAVDLLMSLLPQWYSTIWGIYAFAGLIQSTMGVLLLIIIFMNRGGFVKGYVTVEHQHDIAKYMKGFTVFWAYIAFSQFMLIWYANIPEETEFYIMRSLNGWMPISFALLIFRFIVPFLALLPRGAKRNPNHVIAVVVLILIMQYVDIYWMVYPNFFEGHPKFGFWEVGMFLGFAGIFLSLLMNFFTKHNIVAIKDPRMHEAVSHHVAY